MNARIKWLKNQLIPLKIEGIIVSNPVNVRYLTGLEEEGTLVIGKRENIFITDGRYIESVNSKLTIDDEIVVYDSRNMSKYDYENIFEMNDNVGFEEKYVTYEQYERYLQLYKVNLTETEGLIENGRIVKDEEETSYIQKACEITDNAFEYIIKNIKKGMTEKDIAFEIEKFMIKNGADRIAFDLIVASGENSSMPHAVPTDRVIQKGDVIQFDIGCKYNGYCSDFSRVVFVDEIKEEYKKVYDFVLDQQEKLKRSLRDGANIKLAIKDRETDYKLKNYSILHAFGHGVGLDIHEQPVLRSSQDCILKENSIIAIEPGVYIPGKFGIRIEDTFKVTKFDCTPLTKSSKEICVLKI